MIATDRAGNVAEESFKLTVHRAGQVAAGPGTVDPVSGRFDLSSQDVSVAGGAGSSLGMFRIYDSREPAAGESGPLGPQWSLGLGGSQSIVEGTGGSMLLRSSTGVVSTFASNGKGGFVSPPGDGNLALSEEVVNYERQLTLHDASENSSTTYTIPGGWSAYEAETSAREGEEPELFRVNASRESGSGVRIVPAGGTLVECGGSSWHTQSPEYLRPRPRLLWFKASYSECTSFGFLKMEVNMNGCQWVALSQSQQVALGNCAGKEVTLKMPSTGCEIEVPEQGPFNATYTNVSKAVDVHMSLRLKDTVIKSGLYCTGSETEYTTLEASMRMTAESELGEPVPLTRTERKPPVWMPSSEHGPVASQTTTFSWETVSGKIEPSEELAPIPSGVSCAPELKRGCRALTFNYASETTAKSEAPSGWGDYKGDLTRVYLTAWEPVSGKMKTETVAEYSYDSKGRLRAEWNPTISPALKTTYAYDGEGHVVAVTPPGQQPWLMRYGALGEDSNTGRLLSVIRPPASRAFGSGIAPANTSVPTLSTSSPSVGHEIKVSSNGSWSNSPLAYSVQWERCEAGGGKCAAIAGAVNAGYYPVAADEGHALVAVVTAVNAAGAVTAASTATGSVATGTPSEALPAPPAAEGNAITTIDYGVPVSGEAAPYKLGEKEVEAWAQTDDPVEAAAIFPPDEPMGWPAAGYKRASISYLDGHAQVVDQASPGGGIAVSEYNEYNDVIRSLTADDRAAALKEGGKSAEASKRLDTQSSYGAEGTQLESTLGPEHLIKLSNGKEVQARIHTIYSFNEGAPAEGGPYHLVTKLTQAAEVTGEEGEKEVRTSSESYSGQENLGWKLRKPTSTTANPEGLKSTHTTLFSSSTGEVVETRTPASTGEHSAHDTVSVYYSSESNATYPECGSHPEWAGLLCKTLPGAQPKTEGLPELSTTTIETYDLLDEPTKSVQKSGSNTRTTTASYEESGRMTSTQTTGSSGTELPAVKDHYNETTGALAEQSEVIEGKTVSLSGELNSLGQLTRYTDATGNASTYAYDIDGRTTELNDGKGTQKYTYDPTSGLQTEMTDSAAGTFKATYDPEGNITSETLPNGITASYTRNAAGQPTALSYTKTTHCSENCTWYSDSIIPTAHGQWAAQSSTLASNSYTYDALGRLTQTQDTPAGKGCATRIYAYDAETNRTSLTSREPGSKGECATEGGTVESHTYDEANRLTDTGAGYDPFGDLTKLSASRCRWISKCESTYYTDGQARIAQAKRQRPSAIHSTPLSRQSEAVLTGFKTANVLISHYPGPGSTPAWTTEATPENGARNIPGISGGLAAIHSRR